MTLGEFKEKTKDLDDETEMFVFADHSQNYESASTAHYCWMLNDGYENQLIEDDAEELEDLKKTEEVIQKIVIYGQ